ncbi:surface-adhesin E family protein [Chitinibacter sp. ZOR0017]|uniref:surface-adhesin E family protein n=1 Tax=Chitinibacter sp. ZOR0017 TaxID=1339254 RepID=UPI0006460F7F|nr:surface-adhesin E family protein [Chitinibacter sp. ZOR0017]
MKLKASNEIKTVMLSMMLLLTSTTALAEKWFLFQETQVSKIYLDSDSIRRSNNKATVKQRQDFFEVKKSLVSQPPYKYVAAISTIEFDCDKELKRTLDEVIITTKGEKKTPEFEVSGSMPIIGPFMQATMEHVCQKSTTPKP